MEVRFSVQLLGAVMLAAGRAISISSKGAQPTGGPRGPHGSMDTRDSSELVDARDNNTDVISWGDATSSTQTPSR